MRVVVLVVVVAACGDNRVLPDAMVDAPTPPTANPAREIVDTQLAVDLAAMTATATITFGPSSDPGATLEVGDLVIDGVTVDGAPLPYQVMTPTPDSGVMALALPPRADPAAVAITYHWSFHEKFTGASKTGWTLDWPYFCGNVFPCHSDPSDGTTFSLALANVPAGKTAVFPATIPADAPAYQLAWTVDAYTELPLGTTTAGTAISEWYRPSGMADAQAGGAHLVAAFDWLETNLGPYRFGGKFGAAAVSWPLGAYGGMEHHPFIHVATIAMKDESVQIHEASHGWFGDGVRLACWEDLVLSEGTVSYLAAHVLDVIEPAAGAATWDAYTTELSHMTGTEAVWPDSCGSFDPATFTRAPYMRGAFFYRAVADTVGADKLDQALAAFYAAHAGTPARMSDMLQTIHDVTGFDPTSCAQAWLRSTTIPTAGTCP